MPRTDLFRRAIRSARYRVGKMRWALREHSRLELSVVVVAYNIPRELPRTLHALSASYQRHIDPNDYEVIVVDNGSNPPVDPAFVQSFPGHFRLVRMEQPSASPVAAVNRGIAEARGNLIGVMIDGARIASP